MIMASEHLVLILFETQGKVLLLRQSIKCIILVEAFLPNILVLISA